MAREATGDLDLDHRALVTLGRLPGPGLEPADDHCAVALGQGLGHALGQLPPNVDAEEAGVDLVGRDGGPVGARAAFLVGELPGAGGVGVPVWSATVLAACLLVGLGSSPARDDRWLRADWSTAGSRAAAGGPAGREERSAARTAAPLTRAAARWQPAE